MTQPRDLARRIAIEILARKDSIVEPASIEPLMGEIDALLDGESDAATRRNNDDVLFARVMRSIVHRSASAPLEQWIEERPGTAIRPIWDDRSFLVKCAAGTPLPGHVHDREERLVVLDGDLRFGAERFSTGACIVSRPGSVHELGEALEDCLLLVQYGRDC